MPCEIRKTIIEMGINVFDVLRHCQYTVTFLSDILVGMCDHNLKYDSDFSKTFSFGFRRKQSGLQRKQSMRSYHNVT